MSAKDATDNGMDFWNNNIGIQIGVHVAAGNGGWRDVVSLAREAMTKSLAGTPYDQISPETWALHEPEDGIRLAYESMREMAGPTSRLRLFARRSLWLQL